MSNRPFIEYTLVKDRPRKKEVRHLLIHPVDAPSVVNLSQLIAGVETPIATGTEYEMRQKANAVMRQWKEQGFELERDPVFAPLRHTIALARSMGYTFVYDPRDGMRNLLDKVPLAEWTGITPKIGGGYEYAFEGTTMTARPTLPPNHGLNMSPKTTDEMVQVMKAATELQNQVGPTVTFVLG